MLNAALHTALHTALYTALYTALHCTALHTAQYKIVKCSALESNTVQCIMDQFSSLQCIRILAGYWGMQGAVTELHHTVHTAHCTLQTSQWIHHCVWLTHCTVLFCPALHTLTFPLLLRPQPPPNRFKQTGKCLQGRQGVTISEHLPILLILSRSPGEDEEATLQGDGWREGGQEGGDGSLPTGPHV